MTRADLTARYPLRYDVAWYGGLVVVGLISVGFGLSMQYAIEHPGIGSIVLAAAAAVAMLVVGMSLGGIRLLRRERMKPWQLARELRRNAPKIQAWEAAVLDRRLQPNANEVQLLEHVMPSEVGLGSSAIHKLHEFELDLYQDTRDGGALWVGQLDTVDAAHSRWWYSRHPYLHDEWYACDREYMAQQSDRAKQHATPGEQVDIFYQLLHHCDGPQEARLELIRSSVKPREIPWLRHFIQTFGHANPWLTADMPEEVQWTELHHLLRHYEAFQRRTPEFEGVPQELALRMHGFGKLIDRYGLELLNNPDPEAAHL